jgi:hypothetical protein
MRYLIVVSLLIIGACSGGMDDRGFPDRTGRTIEEIYADVRAGSYDKNAKITDVIAFDVCDCLTNVGLDTMLDIKMRILAGDLETAMKERENNYKSGFEKRVKLCNDLWTGWSREKSNASYPNYNTFKRDSGKIFFDRVLTKMDEICPIIRKDWAQLDWVDDRIMK